MSDAPLHLEFLASVYKVQDLADHGIRVSLDLSEEESVIMAALHECKRQGVVLRVTVEAEE